MISGVGRLVRGRMESQGVTGRELARRVGCSEGAIRQLISGTQRSGRFRGLRSVHGREPLVCRIQRALDISDGALRRAIAGDDAIAREATWRGAGSAGQIKDVLLLRHRAAILASARDHGASHVRVFGSRARGDAHPDSDVDLLVTFAPGRSLIDLSALILDLREILHRDVDVATERGLHPSIRSRVVAEAVRL